MKMRNIGSILFGAAVGLYVLPAQAMTFADYSATSSSIPNISWTQSPSLTGGTLSTIGTGANTYFSFLAPPYAALVNLPALFTLSASGPASNPVNPVLLGGGVAAEQNLSGSFDFTYTGSTPLVVGSHTYTTGATLLHGTFSGAEILGLNFGSTTSFQDAILSGGSVTFTSAIVGFSAVGDKGLSLELTSVLPFYGASPGQSLFSFTGVSTGSFASDLSSGGGGGGVPEPGVWALMFAGLTGIGAAIRRRKGQVAIAAA